MAIESQTGNAARRSGGPGECGRTGRPMGRRNHSSARFVGMTAACIAPTRLAWLMRVSRSSRVPSMSAWRYRANRWHSAGVRGFRVFHRPARTGVVRAFELRHSRRNVRLWGVASPARYFSVWRCRRAAICPLQRSLPIPPVLCDARQARGI